MTIDVKELREAIARVRELTFTNPGTARLVAMTCDAASAYAATLPREVEVTGWSVVDPDGTPWGVYPDEGDARRAIGKLGNANWQVVRLTGTAVIQGER